MTTTYGLLSTGLVRKTPDVIKSEIEAQLLALINRKLNLDPRSFNGQYVGISTGFLNDIWKLIELVYASFRPSSATGQALRDLAALTGTIWRQATAGTSVLTLTGTTGTPIPLGSVVTNASGLIRFSTDDVATIVAASAWVTATPYTTGDIVKNAGHIYVARTTAFSSVAPTTTPEYPEVVIDPTGLRWAYIGDGDGWVNAPATCLETGPIGAGAFALKQIGTPVSGWSGVRNIADVEAGDPDESDEDLRLRRITELHGLSTGPLEAIAAALIEVLDVEEVNVFENPTDVTVGTMSPHSIEAVVVGGTDAAIRACLFANVAAGIQTVGTTSGTVTDSRGKVKTVKHTRPTDLDIYLKIVMYADLDKLPTDALAQALTMVLDYGDQYLTMEYDLEPWAIGASIALKGLLRVEVYADTVPITLITPMGVPIPVGDRQIARLDATRIAISVVSKVP